MRFIFYAITALLIGIIIAVALTEAVVRIAQLAPPLDSQYSYFVPDPVLPYRTAPGKIFSGRSKTDEYDFEYHHNSMGYRDEEHDLVKPEGTFRILALGDSFTYGAGAPYEETYLRRLEYLLQARTRKKVEIIKAGVPRFFPEPQRLLLETEGIKYSPDLVLVGFTPNDVVDTYMGLDAVTVDRSGYLKTAEARSLGSVGTWLYLYSHTFRLLAAKMNLKKKQINWKEVFKNDGLYEQSWKKVEQELYKMFVISRNAGAKFVIVHIPMGPFDIAKLGILDRAYPGRRLARWAEVKGVIFVDALPAIIEAELHEELYWPLDPHCNPLGYRVIAESIDRDFAIRHESMIPPTYHPEG